MTEQANKVQQHLAAFSDARRRGDRGAELRHLDAALELAPQDPQLLNARGMHHLQDQNWGEASDLFKRAAAADPGEPILWINLATARRALDDVPGERAALDRALAADRFQFTALFRKAELEQRAGTEGDAVLAWAAVIQVGRQITNPPQPVLDVIRQGETFMATHAGKLRDRYDALFGADRVSYPQLWGETRLLAGAQVALRLSHSQRPLPMSSPTRRPRLVPGRPGNRMTRTGPMMRFRSMCPTCRLWKPRS